MRRSGNQILKEETSLTRLLRPGGCPAICVMSRFWIKAVVSIIVEDSVGWAVLHRRDLLNAHNFGWTCKLLKA